MNHPPLFTALTTVLILFASLFAPLDARPFLGTDIDIDEASYGEDKIRQIQQAYEHVRYRDVLAMHDIPPEALAWAIMARGVELVKNEQYDKALEDFDAALAIDGISLHRQARIRCNRAWALFGLSDDEAAHGELRKCIDDPKISKDAKYQAYRRRALHYAQSGEREAAIADFNEVIRLHDEQTARTRTWNLHRRADLYRDSGKLEEAVSEYTAIIKSPDTDEELSAWAYGKRAPVLGLLNRPEEALSDYTTVLQWPTDQSSISRYDALRGRAVQYDKLGRHDEAKQDRLEVTLYNRDSTGLIRQGLLLADENRHDEAVQCYTKVIDTPGLGSRERELAIQKRCASYLKLNKRLQALDDYQTLIDSRSSYAALWAYRNRGDFHRHAGRHKQAIVDYTAVIEHPDSSASRQSGALIQRGNSYCDIREYELADADYTAVMTMQGVTPNRQTIAAYSRGRERLQHGRHADALPDLNAALQTGLLGDHLTAWAHYFRADIHEQNADEMQAIADYNASLAIPHRDTDLTAYNLYKLAKLYSAQQRDNDAIDAVTRFLQHAGQPDNVRDEMIGLRAMHLARRGDSEAAIADYTALLDSGRQNETAIPSLLMLRAVELMKQNRLQPALDDLRSASKHPGLKDDAPLQTQISSLIGQIEQARTPSP